MPLLYYKLWTDKYTHKYYFEFKGKVYLVHSIVRLTEEGRKYLGAMKREAILTECFIMHDDTPFYKYMFKSSSLSIGITNASTDRSPDELVEDVIMPASDGYSEREIFGRDAPSYTSGKKISKKDWEIPELRIRWIIFILVVIFAGIFQPWYLKLLIRGIAGWIFGIYRKAYIETYTVYQHDEDLEIEKKKLEVLYK